MTRNPAIILIFAVIVLSSCAGCNLVYRYQSPECKRRGKAYSERVEKLKRDAATELKPSTKQDAVLQFFKDHGIPPTMQGDEITGTIYLKGCAPTGCGSDDALLGLSIEVDKKGIVTSKPEIGAIYTDCL